MSWKEVRNWIPFWITAVFLAVICFSLPLFGDDYSYAQYMRGGFSAFLSEMKTHYLTVNGRTLIHFLDVLLLQGDGWPARVFVWLCSLGVILSSGAFLSGGFPKKETRETFGRAVAACSAGFWIISIWILRESVFWFTGALNYLFPALCVLLALTSLRSGQEGGKGGRLFPVFALLCAFLSEFSAIAAILICLYDGVGRSVKEKKVSPRLLWALLCAQCSLSVFLAPGNAVRTAYYPDFYELSLPARVLSQMQEGCEVYLTDKGLLSVLCALLLVRGVLTFERKGRGRILPALAGFCGLFTVLSEGLDLYARADVRLLAVFPVMGTVFVLADMASE
ncbi:MAG: hypothetical protein II797_01520, partial [Clostridia bacterium]|nr:hypothetical protein [Clostridia bacterium]